MIKTILYCETNTRLEPCASSWIPIDLVSEELKLTFMSYQGETNWDVGFECDAFSSQAFNDLVIGCYNLVGEKYGWLNKIDMLTEGWSGLSIFLMPYSETLITDELALLAKRQKEKIKQFLYAKKNIDSPVNTITLFDDYFENRKFTQVSIDKIIENLGSIWLYQYNEWGRYFIVISKNAIREKSKILQICQSSGIRFQEVNSPSDFPVN